MPATLTIHPWPDPVIDTLGYDPRSRYVETFWLPTLGPTAVLLLRHLADRFDRQTGSIELTVSDTSHALGLGQRDGSSSPIVRTLSRLAQFDLACDDGADKVAVRRNLPPVNRRHLRRLPAEVQATHAEWTDALLGRRPARDRTTQRAPRRVHAARTRRRRRPRRAGAARHRASTRPSRTRARGGPTSATVTRSEHAAAASHPAA